MTLLDRRQLITGIGAFLCAPAIVRASSLMPIKVIKPSFDFIILVGHSHFMSPIKFEQWQQDDPYANGRYVQHLAQSFIDSKRSSRS